MTEKKIVCTDFKELDVNTLKGVADIHFPGWGMTFNGVMLHEKDGSRYILFPSAPMQDTKSKEVMRDGAGKVRYKKPFVSFNEDVKKRFGEAVIAAIDDFRSRS